MTKMKKSKNDKNEKLTHLIACTWLCLCSKPVDLTNHTAQVIFLDHSKDEIFGFDKRWVSGLWLNYRYNLFGKLLMPLTFVLC